MKAGPLALETPLPSCGVAGSFRGEEAGRTGGWPWRVARLAIRLTGFGIIVLGAFLDYGLRYAMQSDRWSARQASLWLSRWSKLTLRWLKVSVVAHGVPPKWGMLVSNHFSYLDFLVFASVQPMIFVARADVRRWPVFGWLVWLAGTLFLERKRRLDVAGLNLRLTPLIVRGNVIGWFPEASRSGGQGVGRFHSALLVPAWSRGWPVTPACLRYTLAEGSPRGEVCYRGGSTFLAHLLNLLTAKESQVSVVFGQRLTATTERKRFARELQSRVACLFHSSERLGVVS